VIIPARFNGPPDSANGGYTCGLVAEHVDAEVVEVSLRAPPPLERELSVERRGDEVLLMDGDTLVAEGRPAALELGPIPAAVPVPEAEEASRRGFERWSSAHPFPTCYVCGPARDDGLGIHPGEHGDVWASAWDGEGSPWAALDCPTSAPVVDFSGGSPCVLARLTARVGDVRAGAHSIVSWPIEVDGRKRHSGAAMFDSDGSLVASARALWIELRQV
jgi:hypothetical protein